MRILQVVGGLDRGGAETWLVQVLRHIDRQKYQFDFLVHGNQHYAYEDEVLALGSRVIRCLSPGNPLKYALNFRRVLREYGPYDCVHSHVHHFSGYVMLLAQIYGVPLRIAHSHNDTSALWTNSEVSRKAYLSLMERLMHSFATKGLAVSAKAADDLFPVDWRNSSRWEMWHLGIDFAPFERTVDKGALRAQLGIKTTDKVIGHVGRFFEQKNHSFLVEIAAQFLDSCPETVFLLVGDGPLRPMIEDRVNELGMACQFRFAGVRPDVPKLMKGIMDAFLFPSLYEGLPLVLMEAQVAGLQCLISDTISEEADLVPSLVARESLANSAVCWSRKLQALLTRTQPPETAANLKEHSLEASVERLIRSYRG